MGKRYELARKHLIDLPIIATNFIHAVLAAAAAGGHLDIAELCIPRGELMREPLESLLNRLPRSKSKGWGPLHWAASNGHLSMTHLLIAHGVSALSKAFDGLTAADLARRHGHDEIEVFLERQEELEKQHPKLVNKAQLQDLKDNLRIHGMLVSAIYLMHEAHNS